MGCASSHETGAISPTPHRVDDNVEPSTDAIHDDKVEDTKTVNANTADDPKDDIGEMGHTSETAETSSNLDRPNDGTKYNSVVSSEDRDDASQEHFEHAVRSACLLLRPEALLECANRNVYKLVLHRSLPHHTGLRDLLRKLPNLQVGKVKVNSSPRQ